MQHRYRTHAVTLSSIFLGLFVAAPAGAASLQQVSDWGASGVPSYVKMYIYVPDKLAAKPPILVSAHSCGSNATGQMGNIPKIKAAADANGFILILPDNPGQNCWDVGATSTSLKHDGGGDTKAVTEMVKYALTKYNGDATRVYAMGGSSGAMLTQALMAVYPDVFRAGSARAGVPAGCWADGYATSNQWSNTCAAGSVSKTAQQWGDLARGMYAGYTGHRPRLQIMQGDADTTISFKNSAEAIKQWTNVLALSSTPTSTDMTTTSIATYSRQFWKNACGYVVFETWAGHNGTHSMGYEEDDVLKFFGLNVAGGTDPEPDCPAGGSMGSGGASSSGGAGTGGNSNASGGGNSGGAPSGSGGAANGGSGTSIAGGPAAAGSPGNASGASGGAPSASGGSTATPAANAGAPTSAGGSAGGGNSIDFTREDGCSIGAAGRSAPSPITSFVAAALGALLLRRRRARG